ncbi:MULTISPECIES: MFS transporter [unclassified Streptomyces]|uniref:MFS transporter n=1 Tax=unclassified Streptomyces TaxID=2593676 RepID=UPI0015D4DC9F|nr:MFS transporter [Streptomyces sp. Ru87]
MKRPTPVPRPAASVAEHPGSGPPAPRRTTAALTAETLLGSLGLFSVIPVLGLLLAARSPGSGTAVVGIGLFCYTASAGLSATLAGRLLARLDYAHGMAGALLTSAVAFGLLPYAGADWALCGLVILAGFGVSTHFLLSRVLIAEVISDDIGRNRVFSLLQISVNAAAALGPFVANLLYASTDPRPLMAVVSLCYAAAAVTLLPGVPRGRKPPPTSGGWPVGRQVLLRVARTPDMARMVAVSFLGTFVYAQFYSAFVLYVGEEFTSAALRSALVAGPAVAIVLLQTAVTAVTARFLRSGATPLVLLGGANLLFGVSLVVLGLGLPAVLGAVLAVAVFAVAEMVFGPMVSTAFAGLPIGSSLEAFNLRQLCWTAGEALGALTGGSLFLALYAAGDGSAYWSTLGVVTLLATGLLLAADRRAGRTRPRPAA